MFGRDSGMEPHDWLHSSGNLTCACRHPCLYLHSFFSGVQVLRPHLLPFFPPLLSPPPPPLLSSSLLPRPRHERHHHRANHPFPPFPLLLLRLLPVLLVHHPLPHHPH